MLRTAVISVAVLSCCAGCQGPTSAGRADIVRVSTFYSSQDVWLNFDQPPTLEPEGFKCSVFLTPSNSDQGVFGDGTIAFNIYRVDRAEDGQANNTLVHSEAFDTDRAYGYRGRVRKRYGWGYGFRVKWGDVDLRGQEIMILAMFTRQDGRTVMGQPKYFKVPNLARAR